MEYVAHEISILQIGDIHFDQFELASTSVDLHDHRLDGSVATSFPRSIKQIISKSLQERLRDPKVHGVVICGDISSKGSLPLFEKGVEYLSKVFSSASHLTRDQIHFVPGNHDVDYLGNMSFVDLDPNRFEALHSSVEALGMGELTMDLRKTQLFMEVWSPMIYSVNSCLAAGAPRNVPSGIVVDAIQDLLMKRSGLNTSTFTSILESELRAMGHEVLDMPLITPEILSSLVTSIRNEDTLRLPIVVAHHGFLPQGIPRLNPYAEMINGGQVREALLSLGRPVLYLHGHVHRSIEEKIEGGPNEYNGGGPVLTVSAPTLTDGFNEIIIEMTSTGEPLGVIVRRHRVNRTDGTVRLQANSSKFRLAPRRLQDERFKPITSYVIEHTIVTGQSLLDEFGSLFDIDELKDFIANRVWQGVFDVTADSHMLPFHERNFVFK